MANSLNKVQLIGNLTGDPEVRETPNGAKVATFSLATNYSWKDANGNKQDEVEYHNIVVWRGLADVVWQYTSKGKKVYIEGRIKSRSYDDAAGVKRYRTEIVADNLILLSTGGGREDGSGYSAPLSYGAPDEEIKPKKATPRAEENITIEDVPF